MIKIFQYQDSGSNLSFTFLIHKDDSNTYSEFFTVDRIEYREAPVYPNGYKRIL